MIWEKVLSIHPIGIRDSFFDLGGHSLLAVRLVSEIGKAFKKSLVPSLLFQAPTIEQFAESIGREGQSWSSLMPIQPGGSKRPFFWIHGDSSAAYLSRYLGPDQPLYGLEHQSQDGKAARYTYVESIAANYFREIQSVQAQEPYYLGGYSFGSIVALEIAQQLKDQAEEVALLVLLDLPEPLIGIGTASASSSALSDGKTSLDGFRDRLRRHSGNLAGLGYREKIAYLRERVVATVNDLRSVITSAITNALKKGVSKVCLVLGRGLPASVRSHYILGIYHRARLKYRMRSYAGRVVLFKGDGRPHDYVENWQRYLVGNNLLYDVPGSHLELRQGTYIHNWAEPLNACLEAAQAADDGADQIDR